MGRWFKSPSSARAQERVQFSADGQVVLKPKTA
jgi:hypothetical protein